MNRLSVTETKSIARDLLITQGTDAMDYADAIRMAIADAKGWRDGDVAGEEIDAVSNLMATARVVVSFPRPPRRH